jgi:protein-S-isoprenylcysteine O-methyltransferase Ste14
MSTPQSIALSRETFVARLEAAVFAWRNWLAALPVVAAWLAMPHALSWRRLAGAAALIIAGAALRAWSTLYNRYAQGEKKTLATGGPYSWLRNPLYLANALVLTAGMVAAGLWAWLPPALGWFAAIYGLTVRHEERRLTSKYGPAYGAYCERVPRWWPRRLGERPRVPAGAFAAALAVQSRTLLILAPFLLRGI